MPAIWRIGLKSIFILFFAFFVFAAPTLAVPTPPNPQPCKNPQEADDLVSNYITEDGKAPKDLRWEGPNALEVIGTPGQTVDLPRVNFSFTIDFSKLQSLFANTNSDYLEGDFQSDNHRSTDVTDLQSQDFNQYHGADQKTSPKSVIDPLKANYVKYVYEHPNLPESANKYTDLSGTGTPKTVYDLVTAYGLPNPPSDPDQNWLDTWGKYWEKIPTSWSEFYTGKIYFHSVVGKNGLDKIRAAGGCPNVIGDPIEFVVPEFFRTTAISDQLNRQIVAKEAQSFQNHGIIEPKSTAISNAIQLCWDLIKNSTTSLKKAVKISLNLANPIKTAKAADANLSCIKVVSGGKEGQAPYCPLPQSEASKPGVSCTNKDDSNKLETNNPNVVCTFIRTLTGSVTIDPNSTMFDSCQPIEAGRYKCKVPVQVFPDIQIPWIAAIWNNTLYSQEESGLLNQKTGRPGIFGFFTPKSVDELRSGLTDQEIVDMCLARAGNDPLCQSLGQYWQDCVLSGDKNRDCTSEALKQLSGASKDSQSSDPKERFVGGVDCSKGFVRDIALKPIAVQAELDVKPNCELTAAAAAPSGTPGPSSTPAPGTNCGGKYSPTGEYPTTYFSETGNFGDPNCDYSESQLFSLLQSIDPSNANFWYYRVISCESGYNPNAMRHHVEPGQSNTPDPAGAWVLFQMGRGLNGPFDHGDVAWRLSNPNLNQQVRNAVNYKNQVLHGSFAYWACAGV